MKTNVQVKDEPVELQVNELLRLYGYNLTNQSSIKPSRTKPTVNNNNNQEQEPSTCAWCQKLGIRSFTLRTDNDDSKTLCSEVCFNQYRRASFKKNKGSESDVEHNALPIVSTVKNKSSDKKNGTSKHEHQINDPNRRKLLLPFRRPTTTTTTTGTISKTKTNGITRNLSSSPSSKRHRSSSSSSASTSPTNGKVHRTEQTPLVPSNLPVSLSWQPSLFLPSNISWPPPSPVDVNRFQYPFFAPPPPPLPPPPPPHHLLPAPLPSSVIPITSSDTSSSNLFATLTKGTLSNYTCILPTFIPLPIPIPIPLCFPIQLPHTKCSIGLNHQQCQTLHENNTHEKRTRRLSI